MKNYISKKIIFLVVLLTAIPFHYSLAIIISTFPATNIGATSAIFNGSVDPEGLKPTVYFKFAESSSAPPLCSLNTTAWSIRYVNIFPSMMGQYPFKFLHEYISGLKPETNYKFCAVGTNATGKTDYGDIKSFKTTALPLGSYSPIYSSLNYNSLLSEEKTVYIAKPIDITESSAKLSASLIPGGKDFSGYFRYSSKVSYPPVFCNDIYGSDMRSTNEISLGNSNSSIVFSTTISDLEPDTKYYYCAVGSSKNHIRYSEVGSFTTDLSSLSNISVATKSATVVDAKSAYLNGLYNTGVPASTWFEYRKMSNNANHLEKQTTVGKKTADYTWSGKRGEKNHTNASSGDINYLLTGLDPNTTYQYRAAIRGNSDLNAIYGEIYTFKTQETGSVSDGGYSYDANINTGSLTLGQVATPPVDAVVHYHEGIEHVLVRQIMSNPTLARRYGYQDGMNLSTFAWDTAHFFAQIFGYVASDGKEIRVSTPDIAAYRLELKNGDLFVYEYYNGVIIHIQSMTEILREKYGYEYYWQK